MINFRPGTLSTNRGNNLLIKLLKFRFPKIIDPTTVPVLRMWLNADKAERKEIMKKPEFTNCTCPKLFKQLEEKLKSYIEENSNSFPMLIGQNWTEKEKSQMTIFLVSVIELGKI